MPEVPQLKKFPYETTKRCPVCHPAKLDEPPFLSCVLETPYAGTQVTRTLECSNCGYRDQDVFDTRFSVVVLDHELDIRAARGQAR